MGQITFYLDDELEQQLHHIVAQENRQMHHWLKEAVQQKLNNGWKTETLDLAGSWSDMKNMDIPTVLMQPEREAL